MDNKIFAGLIETREWAKLRNMAIQTDPSVLARVIEDMPDEQMIILFRSLPRQFSKETFQLLSHDRQEDIVNALARNITRLRSLLNDLDPDDRTAFFEELPGTLATRLMQLLSPEERQVAITLMGYPEESIGRLMTPEYVAVKAHFTIQHTLNHVRKYGIKSETLNIIYVVDDEWKLNDEIPIHKILLSSPDELISDLMDNRFVSLSAYDDQESAVRVFLEQDYAALPVTDSQGVLLGIITFDDVMDVAEEESTEDFQKFGAFQHVVTNPVKSPIMDIYKKRILWLCVLVFMNVFSGAAIAGYQNTIQSMISLIFFLPLLIASGGNAGAQTATLIIRSFALGDVTMVDWFKLVGREFVISLLLGLTMALIVSLIATIRAPELIAVVGITMTCTVIAGSLIGLTMPFLFTKLRLDPATASAPLVTSLADILGVIIYFSVASWYLSL
jgi:magnesium transporter